MKNIRFLFPLAWLPASAFAHTGLHDTQGFLAGFSHPFSGLDHLLAMFAVGLWAAQLGGRALWGVPCAFVVTMILGAVLGFYGWALPFVESGIVVSVCFLGVLVAARFTMPLFASVLLVGVFAVFHGHAHGAEIPVAASGLVYGIGFALATCLLHGGGIVLANSLQLLRTEKWLRLAGGLIALSGCYLVFG